jgi:hypothetical protein
MKHTFLILIIAFTLTLYIAGCKSKSMPDSPPAAQVGEDIILIKDIQSYKQNSSEKLTDKQVLDILVEKDLLFQEAQKEGVALSLQEAKQYASEQREIIESSGEEGKKAMDEITKKLGVDYEKYWKDDAPKGYMRAISQSNMKNKIKKEIQKKILESYSGLNNEDVEKLFNEMYAKKIEELKEKYKVKYYIDQGTVQN